jgi:hypothetical protein
MASAASLEKRMARAFEAADYYGYEQAARTLFHRLSTPASPPASHARAVAGALSASARLAAAAEHTAAAALALLAIRHLRETAVRAEGEALDQVRAVVVSGGDAGGDAAARERLRVARAAVKWTATAACGGTAHGDAGLNAAAGRAAAAVGEYAEAVASFVRGDAPEETAGAVWEWCARDGLAGERDLFLARVVLQYLVSQNMGDAGVVRRQYCDRAGWESRGADVPCLVSFCELACMACAVGGRGRALFEKVRAVYGPALAVDPALTALVERVGEMYFGIQAPAPAGMAGMMQNMLRGMMAPS